MIELKNVKKIYGGRCVLNIESLTIKRGERVAVIGPNGAGKTTLLRVIAGFLAPDGGEVINAARATGYMPQAPFVFDMTVLKNVMLALSNTESAEALALAALRKVGLEALSAAKAKTLSGGEKQRMALARMLAVSRELLVLDEPTSATDVAGGVAVERAINDYLALSGATFVFTTHFPSQAQRLAGRVIAMHEGKIAEDGEAARVLNEPSDERVRDFLANWRL